jgi:hypothetical protein
MADRPAINEAEVVKVLLQEYLSARKEVLLHVQLYKTVPVRNAAILTAVVGLLIPLLTGQNIPLPVTGVVVPSNPWTDLMILFTISTIAFLLVFSVLALLFSLQVLAERCVWLEDEINKCLRGPYLLWERFARQIWSTDSKLVYKMPDAGAAIFFHLLVLIFALFLPTFVLVKILCGTPDVWLKTAVFGYAIYLFAVPALSFYVNVYTMGKLRPYCAKLFQQTREGNDPPPGPSGLSTLLIIAAAAGAVGCVLLVVIPQPDVCAYVGPRFASPPVASAVPL